MKKWFTALAITLFVFPAFSDFTGDWTGRGMAQDSQGWTSSCPLINAKIHQSDNVLMLESGYFLCHDFTTESKPLTFEIVEGTLWRDRVNVGIITDQYIQVHIKTRSGGYADYVIHKNNDGTILFNQSLTFMTGEIVEVISTLRNQDF